jgi:hypothetical protein
MRPYVTLIALIIGLASSVFARGDNQVTEPFVVSQLKADFVMMFKDKGVKGVTDEQIQQTADTLASQVLQQQGSALSFTPDQIHSLQTNQKVFTDAECKAAYGKLKDAANGRPMPVMVEFYKSIFDSGKINPVEQAIFVKLTLAIAARTSK